MRIGNNNQKFLRMKKRKKIKNKIISKKHGHLIDKPEDQVLHIKKDTVQKEGKVLEGVDLPTVNMTGKIDQAIETEIGIEKEIRKGIEIEVEIKKVEKKQIKK